MGILLTSWSDVRRRVLANLLRYTFFWSSDGKRSDTGVSGSLDRVGTAGADATDEERFTGDGPCSMAESVLGI